MRVTPDTNFFISATQWNSSVSHRLLIKLIKENVEIFTTQIIIAEFSEVLIRDFKRDKLYIESLLSNLINFITIVEPKRIINIVKDDPDDNRIVECAVESSSDYILTYDNHLLKIKEFEGIKILKPEDFIKLL